MIQQSVHNRIHYIGGGIEPMMGMWPSSSASNWWEPGGSFTCVAAYRAKGAASQAASYVNLANPGVYDATAGVAPTWATGTGWTFNGSTQYLTTGVVPGSGWSGVARYSGGTVGALFKSADAAPPYFGINRSGGYFYFEYGSQYPAWAPDISTGVLAITAGKYYRNGSYLGAIGGSWTGTAASIYIGSSHDSPIMNYYNGNILAVAFYSTTLDATQMATLSTAMAAL